MGYIAFTDRWLCDPRREALAVKVGVLQADGVALRAWKLGFEYFKNDQAIVPNQVFDSLPHAKEFIEAGLADRKADGTYIRGSRDEFKWYFDLKQQASEAGKKSAEARRQKYGSAVPKNARNSQTGTERPPNDRSNSAEQKPNETEPSSLLFSSSKKKKKNMSVYTDEFDQAWKAYGRRGDKKEAWKEFSKLTWTPDDLDLLAKAINQYHAENPEAKYRLHFCRFLRGDWKARLEEGPVDAFSINTKPVDLEAM